MADVFVSYSRADKARVAPLVAAIKAKGWSVWWDPSIAAGQEFDDQIEAELLAASSVLVVWTRTSVTSRWVRGEARDAAERGILVPAPDGSLVPRSEAGSLLADPARAVRQALSIACEGKVIAHDGAAHSMTYAELDGRANQWGRALAAAGADCAATRDPTSSPVNTKTWYALV